MNWVGIVPYRIFLGVFRSNSEQILKRKLSSFNKNYIFENEDMSTHFAHTELQEIASQNVVKGFIIDRIEFIEKTPGDNAIKNESFIDIGDSDGIFIKALGKSAISANISEVAVSNIHKKGIEAIRCDAEHLPLKNSSIDHILFFEIFEHLSNPISMLHELYRVCKKSIFLSIPYVSRTNIHRFNYDPQRPIYEHHIFELSDADFRKIVSHSGFSVSDCKVAEVLDGGGNLAERCVFWLWRFLMVFYKPAEYKNNPTDLFCGCFKKFSIYHLVKNPKSRFQNSKQT